MENLENDSPTVDGIALLEAQGIATDDEDEDDIHFCKKCKQVFHKIEAYLEHKVKHDKFKVAYNRASGDRRMVLPTLVKKEPPSVTTDNQDQSNGQENTPVQTKTRKRRKKRVPAVDVELIAERSTYICNKCDRKFNSDRPYICGVCNMSFKEMAVLRAHSLTHSNVREFKCPVQGCPYAFKTKGSLVRHQRRHTGERPYTCEACGRRFAESGALTRHTRSRNPCTAKTDAELPRYGKSWTYIPNIPAVVSSDKDGDSLVPMVPGEMVVVMTQGENGEQIITEAQVVSNNETVSSLGETQMEEGEVPESEVQEYTDDYDLENMSFTQCRVCKEECQELETLRVHLRTHLADTPFRCGLCHFTSEVREDMRTHMQSKHQSQLKGVDASVLMPPVEDTANKVRPQSSAKDNREAQIAVKQLLGLPQYPNADILTDTVSARAVSRCPICSRAFRGTSYLRQHMKSHTGDRPHTCPICQKSFVTKDTLNKHLIVHTDERNFKCGECGKLFKRIGHVKEHLKIHNTERPFPCSVCDKSFKTNNALKVHVRTHSDCLPYECRTCHRQFREKGSLQRHRRIHTGERPFRCHRCGRGFAEHGTLNRHLRAKVQCTPHPGMQQVEETTDQDSQDVDQQDADPDIPTVLAEFSSVVADTQQYIVADQLDDGDQQTTEYVVLHTDLTSDEIQNVEIVTEGEIDPDTILNSVAGDDKSYVVVSEAGNSLRIIDSSTGLTLATMGTDTDEMHAVTMVPATEVETGSVTVQTEAGSITMVTDEEVSDAVKHAMLVADVVDTTEVVSEVGVPLTETVAENELPMEAR
ncbi:hypothetical protein BaRGS_00000897 [Batillaria attramentaria]|uniref:C2H2-type domain-containing protein n=1 Tax=Batillaria attramentaria TaxID=370345 RepID=A0ABD0M879_9CAEN